MSSSLVESAYDFALSFAADDSWAAKDLYYLLSRRGFSVYSSNVRVDAAGGDVREGLSEIYNTSSVNVVLWSAHWAGKAEESIVDMERRIITSRHIRRDNAMEMMILAVDDTPLPRDFQDVLRHNLKDHGVTGFADIAVDRLRRVLGSYKASGHMRHPSGTERRRQDMHGAKMTIDPSYRKDPHRRWQRLADVLVQLSVPVPTKSVYLIPSGLANALVRHTAFLREYPGLLETKRKATEAFIEANRGKAFAGVWFWMELGDAEVVTAYSEEYDRFLNQSIELSGSLLAGRNA